MKCTVCSTEFESKRSDAKFCSSTCRSKASREMNDAYDALVNKPVVPDGDVNQMTTAVVEVVKIKRECKRSALCCTECVDFESGVHWCPNKGCGCFETREEQLASLNAFQEKCPHPDEELFASRCLLCGHISFVSHSGQGTRKI